MPTVQANSKLVRLKCEAGQLLVVGFEGTAMSPGLRSLLDHVQPGGVILFARNIVSAEQTHKLLRDCRSAVEHPLLTCIDMEGGTVDRFRNLFGRAPSAADVFAAGERSLFLQHGRIIGDCCRTLGFNVDFAPVVDLASETSQRVMGSRVVSADPRKVVLYARGFLAGLQLAGVVGAAKHFPGLSGANLDTHHALPSVERNWKQLWERALYPYRVMRRDLPMVLVGHANYPAVTRDAMPASLSKKWITDVLRKRIGYRGLVVSDDLEMGGVLKAAPIEQAAVQFIRAGGDLCLICHVEEHVVRAYEALVKAAERDRRFTAQVKESAARIVAFKKRSAAAQKCPSPPAAGVVDRLSRRLWELSEEVRLAALAQQAEA